MPENDVVTIVEQIHRVTETFRLGSTTLATQLRKKHQYRLLTANTPPEAGYPDTELLIPILESYDLVFFETVNQTVVSAASNE